MLKSFLPYSHKLCTISSILRLNQNDIFNNMLYNIFVFFLVVRVLAEL